jgi:hypothetical protein
LKELAIEMWKMGVMEVALQNAGQCRSVSRYTDFLRKIPFLEH